LYRDQRLDLIGTAINPALIALLLKQSLCQLQLVRLESWFGWSPAMVWPTGANRVPQQNSGASTALAKHPGTRCGEHQRVQNPGWLRFV